MHVVYLKTLHLTCVVITLCGFLLRGLWMISGSDLLHRRWVRIAPHVVDSALLASGIALAVSLRWYPVPPAWLGAKLVGLVTYIVLGSIALKRGRTALVRVTALVLAVTVFGYIICTAVAHDPMPWRSLT